MSRQDEIRNGIRRLAGGAVPMLLRMGTVTAVDETAQTCTVHIDDGYDLDDVRLTPVEDAELLVVPVVGAWAVVASIENNEYLNIVVSVSAVQKIVVKADMLTINGGTLGGIVNVETLISELKAIKDDLNMLKSKFQSWKVVPNDGGGALKTAIAAWSAVKLRPTDRDALVDDKITH